MDFTVLFSFEQLRLLELVCLLQQKEELYSMAEVASQLAISQKTLTEYLKKLQRKLNKLPEREAGHIQLLKGGYFTYHEQDSYTSERFKRFFLQGIPELCILRALLETNLDIEQLQQNLQISESSIRKKLRKIQNWLHPFNIYLQRKNYQLIGDEAQIRWLAVRFYHYLQLPLFFEKSKQIMLETLVHQICLFFGLNINQIQQNQLYYFVYIVLQRKKSNNLIRLATNWHHFLNASQLFQNFQRKVLLNRLLPNEEQKYLYLMIEAVFGNSFNHKSQCLMIQEHMHQSTDVFQMTLAIMKYIKSEFNHIKFSYEKKHLCNFLCTHLHLELLQMTDFQVNELTAEYTACFPKTMSRLKGMLRVLKERWPSLRLVPEENLVGSYLFKLCQLFNPIQCEKRYFLCLLTDFTPEKEELFGKNLQAYFAYRKNIHLVYGQKTMDTPYAHLYLATHLFENKWATVQAPIVFIPKKITDHFFHKVDAVLTKQ